MTEQVLSTLSEINRQLKDRMYELMNFIMPSYWTDLKQVIYSPSDDLDFATQLYQEKYGSPTAPNLILPFAFLTRYTGEAVLRTYEQALRPWNDWLSSHPGQPVSSVQIEVSPAVLLYSFRAFHSDMELMELLFDQLYYKGIREKSRVYEYTSDILQSIIPYRVEIGNPKYERIPNLPDRLRGKGRLYSVLLPFECRCLLGESEPAVRIYDINVDLHLSNSPTVDDGFVIDSSTVVSGQDNNADGNTVIPVPIVTDKRIGYPPRYWRTM
jgi:hypothetical protein